MRRRRRNPEDPPGSRGDAALSLRVAAYLLAALAIAAAAGGVVAGLALVRYSPYLSTYDRYESRAARYLADSHPYAPIGWVVLAGGLGVAAVLLTVAWAGRSVARLADERRGAY